MGNWQVGGIANVSSGEQLTVLITFDHANYGGGSTVQRPDPVPGANPLIGNTPNGYLDRDAFTVRDSDPSTPGVQGGILGSLGRGTFTGPKRYTFDFSLIKQVSLGADSSRNLQFRAEFFNITNKANFGRMGTRAFFNTSGRGPGSFGNFRNTVTTSRQIQFAVKISF